MEIRVSELRLPGVGRRYELTIEGSRRIVVVGRDEGGYELGITQDDPDAPGCAVGLDDSEAAVLAALLTGARFSIESPERVEPDDLSVRTVSLGSRSPLLGRPVTGLALPGGAGEATILAVVRGDEAFVDPSTVSVLQAGDRLVVAAPRRLHEALEELGG